MDAVVLAAGEGERLAPLTASRPKPMLPATNRPILSYVFDALVEAGVESIHVVVGYERDHIREYFGSTYRGTPLEYVVQDKQLGSGHALLQARGHVEGPFLVLNGDQIVEPDMVEAVAEAFDAGSSFGALASIEHDDVAHYGAVSLDGGRVTEFTENPTDDGYRLLNAGVYAFDERVFEAIAETPREAGELSLPETLRRVVESESGEPLRGVRTGGLWVDATYAWDLLTVARRLLRAGWIGSDVDEISESVWVADSARVHESAVLRPPVVIGPDCVVGPNAVVGPEATLGRNVTVEANATVRRSVLDVDTRVGSNASLVDVVAGRAVDVGAGVVAASGRADIPVAGTVIRDQTVGAVLADRVEVGGGASFEPGALVGTDATVGVGTHVSGRVRAGTEVVR